jgi:hypothetical protein
LFFEAAEGFHGDATIGVGWFEAAFRGLVAGVGEVAVFLFGEEARERAFAEFGPFHDRLHKVGDEGDEFGVNIGTSGEMEDNDAMEADKGFELGRRVFAKMLFDIAAKAGAGGDLREEALLGAAFLEGGPPSGKTSERNGTAAGQKALAGLAERKAQTPLIPGSEPFLKGEGKGVEF